MKAFNKKSRHRVGTTIGGIGAALSLLVAVCCPFAGAIAGGMLVWGAASASMGTGAAVALTAAGVLGGGMLGNIAAPIVGWAGITISGLVGYGLNRLFGGKKSGGKKAPAAPMAAPEAASTFKADKVTPAFDSAALKAAAPKDAPAAPQPKIQDPKV